MIIYEKLTPFHRGCKEAENKSSEKQKDFFIYYLSCGAASVWADRTENVCFSLSVWASSAGRSRSLEPRWRSSSCHTAWLLMLCLKHPRYRAEWGEMDGRMEGAGERYRGRNERENGSVSVREKETEQQREGGVSAKSLDFPWDSLTKTDRWEGGVGGQKCHFFLLYWTTTRNAWKHQDFFRKPKVMQPRMTSVWEMTLKKEKKNRSALFHIQKLVKNPLKENNSHKCGLWENRF